VPRILEHILPGDEAGLEALADGQALDGGS
jgi:hypothetical protein